MSDLIIDEPAGNETMGKVLTLPTPFEIRDELTELVMKDLLGPAGGEEEELSQYEDRALGRYLVGLLAPIAAEEMGMEELDSVATTQQDDPEVGPSDVSTPPATTFIPNSMGMSFMARGSAKGIRVQSKWGRYKRIHSETQVSKKTGGAALVWKREPRYGEPLDIEFKDGQFGPLSPLPETDPDVIVRGKMRHSSRGWLVTIFFVNNSAERNRRKDEAWVFQPEMSISEMGDEPTPIFIQRHDLRLDLNNLDPISCLEHQTMDMLYRNKLEFAVGHGVSVHAELPAPDALTAISLRTTFMPTAEVEQQTPPTPDDIPELANVVLDMKQLAEMPKAELLHSLRAMNKAYGEWITREAAKVEDESERLREHGEAAARAIANCQRAARRIEEGISLLATDEVAEASFRFANRAMWQQRIHSIYSHKVRKKDDNLESLEALDKPVNRSWRLFQLAFILLNIPSLTRLDHEERSHESNAVADLLWFATGGGKTEAYLGLTAYTLAMRRLQGSIEGRNGDHGVAVLMRYTLRLLTLQQFQRAAALICACEMIRREDPSRWGKVPFRLGLWVGSKATPNTLKMANEAVRQAVNGGRPSVGGSPLQIVSCPWCGTAIGPQNISVLEAPAEIGRCLTYCGDATGACSFTSAKAPGEGLPVMVVDEDIYRRPPSLLIATVDKFAQMPWNGQVQHLFGQVNGECVRHGFLSPSIDDTGNHNSTRTLPRVQKQDHGPLRPPDLIIQDELHLISGPLGSMVALYETAVDELCSWTVNGKKVRPKVIASTATIRRAVDQVRKIFHRSLEVFPPQGTCIGDSFFSIQRKAGPSHPGRRFVGICAFGRRYPAAMIRVYTATMSAAQLLYERYGVLADPWMTVAGYFNSIRELAGTTRLLGDDIKARLRDAHQRGLAGRRLRSTAELTSRQSSHSIPQILERMELPFNPVFEARREEARAAGRYEPGPYDAVLATNMISVGVDIDRLGLMVVAGQPKTTSEYIQATSRVGRSKNGPGLVFTLFNWARPRDLSHYETFEHYHSTFYKHVEALSVTPFSVRAMDRGLSGIMVGLMRLIGPGFNHNNTAGSLTDGEPLLEQVMRLIVDRAVGAQDDQAIRRTVVEMLQDRRSEWLRRVRAQRDHILGYKAATGGVAGLLEQPGAAKRNLFTCLNSLRDVEGTVSLILDENPIGLSVDE